MITISQQTARRFVLGKQGLWPGRRWRGLRGTGQAMRAIEYLQLDPLQIIARSHDITLHSRVLDYKPEFLYDVAYKERQFFDYAGPLYSVVISPAASTTPLNEVRKFRALPRDRSRRRTRSR